MDKKVWKDVNGRRRTASNSCTIYFLMSAQSYRLLVHCQSHPVNVKGVQVHCGTLTIAYMPQQISSGYQVWCYCVLWQEVDLGRVVNLLTKAAPTGIGIRHASIYQDTLQTTSWCFILAYFIFSAVTSPLHFVTQISEKSNITLQTVKRITCKTCFIFCYKAVT